jgi:mevalonate kinase
LTIKAIAEAPSKAIITGEHFVVHGAWALAAAIPMKVRAELSPASDLQVTSDRFPGRSATELRPIARVAHELAKEFSVRPKVRVRLFSRVHDGAGLGSSAATMVALVSAFSKFHGLGLSIKDVIKYSMIGEKLIHGHPSGIDSTVCAKGGVLLFRVGTGPRKVSLDGSRSLLISFSGETRSTRSQIDKVSEFRDAFPHLHALLTRSIGGLSINAARMLSTGDIDGLGNILSINHAVLRSLGVSTAALDRLVDLCASLGSHGAKLTGAGGGGSVLAVAPEAKEKSIVSRLRARGFETFRAQVPVEGVRSWLER